MPTLMAQVAHYFPQQNPLDNPEVTRVVMITDEHVPRLWNAYTASETVPPLPEYMVCMSRENAERLFKFKPLPSPRRLQKFLTGLLVGGALIAGSLAQPRESFRPSAYIAAVPQVGVLYRGSQGRSAIELRSLEGPLLHFSSIREQNGEWSEFHAYNGNEVHSCYRHGLRSFLQPCNGSSEQYEALLDPLYEQLVATEQNREPRPMRTLDMQGGRI
jgi:hypothetical protein